MTPATVPAVDHLVIRSATLIGHHRQARTPQPKDIRFLVESVLTEEPQPRLMSYTCHFEGQARELGGMHTIVSCGSCGVVVVLAAARRPRRRRE